MWIFILSHHSGALLFLFLSVRRYRFYDASFHHFLLSILVSPPNEQRSISFRSFLWPLFLCTFFSFLRRVSMLFYFFDDFLFRFTLCDKCARIKLNLMSRNVVRQVECFVRVHRTLFFLLLFLVSLNRNPNWSVRTKKEVKVCVEVEENVLCHLGMKNREKNKKRKERELNSVVHSPKIGCHVLSCIVDRATHTRSNSESDLKRARRNTFSVCFSFCYELTACCTPKNQNATNV